MDDEQIKQRIEELVGRYNTLKRSKSPKELEALSEANVRADFIDPLFEILGWKVKDPDEYDREHYVRKVGLADVALKLDGAPVVFVEAKRFGGIPHIDDRGDADWTLEERQVILYAASSKCKWAILTNFEKFRVFNALTGLTILDFESIYDYTDRFGELLYLTRDYVDSGRIERLAEREERQDIDLDFLKMLNNWRIQLANDIYQRNKDNDVLKDEGQLDLEKLKDAVQRTLDRLIIIRWAEDRLVLDDPHLLERKYHDWKLSPTYNSIFDSLFADRALFDKFNDIHDSKIFERGHICEKVKISDDVLGKIIYEMCQRSFRKFDFDILGNTYETYLGNTLYLKDDGTLGLKPSMETRKEAGIYYTPPYVVDYILKNTLGELLKGKTPEEIAKIKVLDPACGSGSFLIKAFDYLNDYYEKENEKVRKRKEKLIKEYMKSSGNQLKLDIEALEHKEYKDVEKEILKNNIHGVDLDRQAAEIASVNLMLKALKPKEKLPLILDENIKVGNSLISGTEDELKQYFGDDWKERCPFNWEDEFKDVFAQDGFDVVIGNPPYGAGLDESDRKYISNNYTTGTSYKNTALIFIERSLKLLKDGGYFGMIVPKSLAFSQRWRVGRELIISDLTKVVDVSKAFKDVLLEQVIIILKKGAGENKYEIQTIRSAEDKNTFVEKRYVEVIDSLIVHDDIHDLKIFQKMNSDCIYLGDISKTSRGLPFQKHVVKTKSAYNVLRGKNIARYFLSESNEFLDDSMIDENDEKIRFLKHPKVISQRIVAHVTRPTDHIIIMSMIDEDGALTLDTIENTIVTDDMYSLKFILSLLNSKLISWYAYRYIFAKAIRTMDLDDYYIGKIPIPKKVVDQSQFARLADRTIALNKQLNSINTDFDHYVNLHPRTEDAFLKHYVDKLPASDKEVLKDHLGKSMNRVDGKFKEFEILEEGEWLVFKVGYLLKTKKGEMPIRNVRAFRCRIADEKLRKFLHYSIKEYTRPGKLGKGNIYERLLKIKIPQFVPNAEKNKRIIDEIMTPFLEEVAKRDKLEKEIGETDRTIDQRVYELYGLTPGEVAIVED